jgi:hypothetical protein
VTLYVYRCPECPATVSLSVEAAVTCSLCNGAPMRRLPDTASALLPLDGSPPSLVPLKVEHLHKAGHLLPETQDALEWLYRHRERNGMAGAFLKVGGRRCIDLVAFARLIREQKA